MKELIGRSRHERKLDGIYNKQRDLLIHHHKNKKTSSSSDIYINLSKRKANESIPFPEIYEKKRKYDKTCLTGTRSDYKNEGEKNIYLGKLNKDEICSKVSENSNSITLYKGIYIILYKHIYSKNKFVKSVSIFINLCMNYMNNENKKIFFFSFNKILNVFHQNYLLYDDHEKKKNNNIYTFYNNNELHIKCIISFFDKIVNKIIDGRFIINYTTEENASPRGDGQSDKSSCTDIHKNGLTISEQKKNKSERSSSRDSNNGSNSRSNCNSNSNSNRSSSDKNSSNKNSSNKNSSNKNSKSHWNEQACKDLVPNGRSGKDSPANTTTSLLGDKNEIKQKKISTIILTKEEKKFLKALKIKIYYLVILFKLNDNFIFNKLMSIYRQIFEDIQKDYVMFEEKGIINGVHSPIRLEDRSNEKTQLSIEENEAKEDKENIFNRKSVECQRNDTEKEMNKLKEESKEKEDEGMHYNDFLLLKDKWVLPNEYEIFKMKRTAFVKCLSNLFHFININWARTLVESLLQDVYLKKYIFDGCDEIIIENLQSLVKANMNKRKNKHEQSKVLSIGESLNPVVDARDEKIVSLHGTHVWSNKQMER
ncbi:conserved Plasmodium protein, unknown function [Plasmodium malariae]|uniref:Uncharacterized protein n=1 Tax=Plasmodium malariae TaxID=5858 RepID=A0A1C3K9X4_PLAMA|nr:conserved Plasmodium protein, unknown function [Plasmodium malariae]